jgi:hypothetical protein
MRFRSPRDTATGTLAPTDRREAEEVRVREWQAQRLSRLGYESRAASQVVRAAWGEGDHTDLVHRIEELIGRGRPSTRRRGSWRRSAISMPMETASRKGGPDAG